ncbi:hypothetical protein K227x_23710 [Rubripirellula lacrimiformis]|uniref:DUF1353 domain-containing protein n=1 Tax=Rubripirellula lacrimiformis TaxID=1930273 RepID=A0A517NA23_9BACT|nr:DUF1353 domain-containing protein [Rubripirellula lacrimiformis]QDT03985.1 hypothetical protein K227x_23710 [Rubripirellula lacrimiformis]
MPRIIDHCYFAIIVLVGCGPSSSPVTVSFGQFEGEVVAQWDANGRDMTLREPISFIDPTDKRWDAPAGSVVNGASIPAAFWSLIGGPFEGKYRNASVVHDVYCEQMNEPWEDVHQMFYQACRSGGVDEAQAKVMYYAVYHFGPRWEWGVEAEVASGPIREADAERRSRGARRLTRYQPTPPTADEIEQVRDFVLEEDPTPSQMRTLDRDQLHRRPRRGDRSRPNQTPMPQQQMDRSASSDISQRGEAFRSGSRQDFR